MVGVRGRGGDGLTGSILAFLWLLSSACEAMLHVATLYKPGRKIIIPISSLENRMGTHDVEINVGHFMCTLHADAGRSHGEKISSQ
jgi:hypothetical protein